MDETDLQSQLESNIDAKLVRELLAYYRQLKLNHFIGHYDRSAATKFIETVVQVLQWLDKGSYDQAPKVDKYLRELKSRSSNLPDSLRLILPRVCLAAQCIRSKRQVHKGEVDPNIMDFSCFMANCDWVLAELIRLYHDCSAEEAQAIVDSLVERKVPLVEEFGSFLKTLDPSLNVRERTLLLLYHRGKIGAATAELKKWTARVTKSPTHVTTVLNQLDKDDFIYREREVDVNYIAEPGIIEAEKIMKSREARLFGAQL